MKNTHKLYTDVIAKSGSKNEPLEVNANGVYEAPKGTGYSPVKVNVPQTAASGTVKALLDATRSASHLFQNYEGASVDGLISFNDTDKVTDMGSMFSECRNLTTIPQLDTFNVTYMSFMFSECAALNTIPQLDTSNVINMNYMFSECVKLTSVPELDTSSCINFNDMFSNCRALTSIGIHGFTRSVNISKTALKHDALVAFLNQAGTAYNSSQEITMGSAKLALLSDEEKAIATNKGWTLA